MSEIPTWKARAGLLDDEPVRAFIGYEHLMVKEIADLREALAERGEEIARLVGSELGLNRYLATVQAKLSGFESVDRRNLELIAANQELTAKLAALEGQEPVDWIELNKEADAIVRNKSTWKRFIDGTPLANDIAVWMADFAESYAAAGAAPNAWKDAVLNALADHGMDAPMTDTPEQIVKSIIAMTVTMATDPAIAAGAAPAPEGRKVTTTRIANHLKKSPLGDISMYRDGFFDGAKWAAKEAP